MKRTPTVEDLDAFASNLYCTPEMIYKISPLTRKGVQMLVKSIIKEMEAEGLPAISYRPVRVPVYRVMERLDLGRKV